MAIEVIDTLEPKNGGSFPVANAEHVAFREGRLPDYLPVPMTQDAYDALQAAGKVNPVTPYLIVSDEA